MPSRSGRFTAQEATFIDRYAATGDPEYAGSAAGYTRPMRGAQRVLARPEARAAIATREVDRLYNEGLPLAVERLVSILRDDGKAPRDHIQAAKLVLDRTIAAPETAGDRDVSEMSSAEIARKIASLNAVVGALEQAAADKATPVDAVRVDEVDEPGEADLFG